MTVTIKAKALEAFVAVAVGDELWAKPTPDKAQVNATMARIRIFMGRELEEFSTE